jgi:hypothetical protein
VKKIEKLLVCVGAQKAGTTWLHEVLEKDNRLKIPFFRKEVQYFNYKHINSPLINQWRASWLMDLAQKAEFRESLIHYLQRDPQKNKLLSNKERIFIKRIGFCLRPLNDDWYCDYLAIGAKKQCAIDVSPEYAVIGQAGFENMKAVTDNLKLVFILRDPVERSWSGMIQELKHRPDAKNQLDQMKSATIDSLLKRAKNPNIHKRSDYLKTFQAIKSAGLSDCLKVIYYDDIVTNPSQVIHDIYTHIEMKQPAVANTIIEKVIHKSPTLVMPEQFMVQMRKAYAPMLAQINNEFISLPEEWKKRYAI